MRRLSPLLLLLAACAAPGYRGLWTPKPAELLVTGADGAPAARLLAAVLGEWRGGEHDREIHVRVRLENIGAEPLRLPLARVELRAGDLAAFAPPYVLGGDVPAQVDPGGAALLDLAFAPPAEGADLRGLHLSWVLLLGERELPGSVTLQRAAPTWVSHWHGGFPGWYPYGPPYGHGAWHDGWVTYVPAPPGAAPPAGP